MKEKEEPRRFSGRQRADLYLASGGVCEDCGVELAPGWHADHVYPWSKDGHTDVANGQALCPACNLKKGSTMVMSEAQSKPPREWQLQAWDRYDKDRKRDWLLCATPGAGKTTWSLGLARRLLNSGTIDRVVVVAPTQTIRDQWKEQTIVHLDAVVNRDGGLENSRDFEGVVLTYAQVANNSGLQRIGCARAKTLVIFDEIHHAGYPNMAWGEAAKDAFELAVRRIALTGTPWRRPGHGKISFVTYDEKGKLLVDFAYEYGQAVRDKVCRSVEFRAYDGTVKYVSLESCAPQTYIYSLEDEDDKTPVLRSLLDPSGAWMKSMIQMAHAELLTIRSGSDGEGAYGPIPDAKGLVIADTQIDARAIGKLLERLTTQKPEIIISDEPDAKQSLERFKSGPGLWAVAVNQVSEGVDVPPLYVGVYATRKRTPLIFRQIIGRFVRRRVDIEGHPRPEEERSAVVFMPAVTSLKELAAQMEDELRHELDLEQEEGENELRQSGLSQGDNAESDDIIELPSDISPAELDTIILSGVYYSREEYDDAVNTAKQVGIPLAYAINLAAAMRLKSLNAPVPVPAPQGMEIKETPLYKVKAALLKKIDRLAKSKALALGVDFKEFNAGLAKRFGGTRRTLSIDVLKEQLRYLEQLEVDE